MLAITTGGGLNAAGIAAGTAAAAAGIIFNVVQGAFGVAIAALVYPVLLPLFQKYILE